MSRIASQLRRLRRPVTLGLVGLSATALYASLALIGTQAPGVPAAVSSVIAYAIAATASYWAHRRFTFAAEGSHGAAPARFALLSLAGYAIAFASPLILTDTLKLAPLWAIALTCIAVPALNALALSRLVFRKPLIAEQDMRTS